MRAFTLVLSSLLLTLIATSVTAKESRGSGRTYTCRLVTGYGTAIGRGPTPLAAKEDAQYICGSKLIDQYMAQRGRVEADAEDDLVLACINLDCQ